MESHVLLVRRSHGAAFAPRHQVGSRFSSGMKRFDGVCPTPSSLGKQQWQFRVEKGVTLGPPRKTSAVEVRAKKSGLDFKLPGSLKRKKSQEPTSEDDEETTAGNGTQKFGTAKLPGTLKLPGTVKLPGSQRIRRKDNNVVFVAGATGKVGRRVVRELLQLGYAVRAGVRDVEKAQFLVEFAAEEPEEKPEKKSTLWANFAPEKLFGFLGSAKKEPGVDLVEIDLENSEEIEDAIGNAGVVVCAIGASEKEALNATAPYRIDFKATENLINAASDAKVNHFVLVTSLGTQKVGWPAAALNLFWGVLIWKAKAEKALISSGIPFTIVRPGGMERPTDAYKETHNLVLDTADSRFGGQVSNLQVAELIGGIVSNLKLSQNKIVEVVAETTAPLRLIEDLLAELPSLDDIEAEKEAATQKFGAEKAAEEEEKLAKKKELEEAKLQEEEDRIAAEEKRAAEQAKTEALREKLQKEYSAAKEREEDAKRNAEEARLEKEVLEKRVADLRSKAEAAVQAAKEAKAVEVAVLAAVREGKTLSEKEKKDIVAAIRAEAKAQKGAEAKAKAAEEKAKKEAEIKAIREAEAARVEAEKKRQAEEAKIVAEVERVAMAEADLKAKAEAEKKAKVEAEAKAKAAAEERANIEAAKNKAEEERLKLKEEEEKLKAAAEAKAKAEEEQKVKAEAEAKAKEEAEEEKLKAEAEADADAKAKEEAEDKAAAEQAKSKEVQVVASADVFTEKKSPAPKPFRWPWQKEPETEEVEGEPVIQDAMAEETAEEKADELPRTPTPLSPYSRYPDLKPPTSPKPPTPTATPSTPELQVQALEVEIKVVDAVENLAEVVVDIAKGEEEKAPVASSAEDKEDAKAEQEELQRLAAQAAAEAKAREEAALEKAKATTATFLWPWQKPKPEEKEVSPAPVVSSSSTSVQDELPRANRPLSPYTRYLGLRPPSSPTPSAPITVSKLVTEELASNNGFVDLKPPSSPTPSTPPSVEENGSVLAPEEPDTAPKAIEATAGKFFWPQKREPELLYKVEEASLPEAAPDSTFTAATAVVENIPVPQLSSTETFISILEVTSSLTTEVVADGPLALTRYPDLKPPTSPTPSPPRAILKEKLVESTRSESTPWVEQEALETVTEVLKTASAGNFKWPWQ